jgi:acylphosphatase
MKKPVEHRSLTIRGTVQGVSFRRSTKEEADRLGLKGFVRNQPDGSVYIEAEGSPAKLDALFAWCGHGPARAQVESCEMRPGSLKHFKAFVVDRKD